jgi:predicted nucleic-acid-binding Zn-ribbon protein
MCKHEKFKIAERLFNKFGKPVATAVYCLKCGYSEKLIINKEIKKENRYDIER